MAWVTLDDRDNDPAVLLTYVATALDRVERIDPVVFRALTSSGAGIEVPRRLVAAVAAMGAPIVLVVDDVDRIVSRECVDALAALALGVPAGSQVAFGSREAMPLPAARLRAQGAIVEIGVDELAMDRAEAAALLAETGIELPAEELHELVERRRAGRPACTSPRWPCAPGARGPGIGVTFSGDDRYIGDYLRSEFLDRVSPADVTFLTRTSILDRMSGPLCDAVRAEAGSSDVLERLERRNLLVVPLDRRREWYRYHHLFRDLLLTELRRREPDAGGSAPPAGRGVVRGQRPARVGHRPRPGRGEADTVARLVLQLANPVWASGRSDTVLRWMRWFETSGLDRAVPRDRGARRADVRPGGPAGGHRALGGGRRGLDGDGPAGGRQHRRGDAGLPAGAPVPQRVRSDAC